MQNHNAAIIKTNHASWSTTERRLSLSASKNPTVQEEPFHKAWPKMAKNKPVPMVVGMGHACVSCFRRIRTMRSDGTVVHAEVVTGTPCLLYKTQLALVSSER